MDIKDAATRTRKKRNYPKDKEAETALSLLFELIAIHNVSGETVLRLNSKCGEVKTVSWGVEANNV